MLFISIKRNFHFSQVLYSLPEVQQRYVSRASEIFDSAPSDASQDLLTQMAKVGVALVNGRTGKTPAAAAAATEAEAEPMDTDQTTTTAAAAATTAAATAVGTAAGASAAAGGGGQSDTAAQEANSVRPAAFKVLVGKGHPEFSSGRQQVGLTIIIYHLFDIYILVSL